MQVFETIVFNFSEEDQLIESPTIFVCERTKQDLSMIGQVVENM